MSNSLYDHVEYSFTLGVILSAVTQGVILSAVALGVILSAVTQGVILSVVTLGVILSEAKDLSCGDAASQQEAKNHLG